MKNKIKVALVQPCKTDTIEIAKAAPAKGQQLLNNLHVFSLSHGRIEFRECNRVIGDLTAQPQVANTIVDLLIECRQQRDGLTAALKACQQHLRDSYSDAFDDEHVKRLCPAYRQACAVLDQAEGRVS